MADGQVFIGVWKNLSYNNWTLTLEPREGGFLITALVIWISLCSLQFWNLVKILVYLVSAAQGSDRDLFYHQLQALVRNSSSGTGIVYGLTQLSWSSRKHKRAGPVFRVAIIVAIGLIIAAGWFAVAFFTSFIYSKSGPDVLLRSSPRCGLYLADRTVEEFGNSEMKRTTAAAQYVRQCYGLVPESMPGSCVGYPVQRIPFYSSDTDCPFNSGNCVRSNSTPYQLDTGYIDTSTMLGIEAEEEDRVQYRRVVQCSPAFNFNMTTRNVTMKQIEFSLNGQVGYAGNIQYNYHIGQVISQTQRGITNTTFSIWDTSGEFPFTYNVLSHAYHNGEDRLTTDGLNAAWLPNTTFFNRTDADLAIFSIASNHVTYLKQNYDPIFMAGAFADDEFVSFGIIQYRPSHHSGILSCTEQHQFCRSDDGNQDSCTSLMGRHEIPQWISNNSVGFNVAQITTIERLWFSTIYTGLSDSISERQGSSLLASDTLSGYLQHAALPNDQWRIEAANWFAISLAKLQATVVAYATGPSDLSANKKVTLTGVAKQQCGQQRVRRQGYQNFDMTAIVIVAVVGIVIIAAGLGLEHCLNSYYKHAADSHVWKQWEADGILELRKTAFEESRPAESDDTSGAAPTSKSKLLTTTYEKRVDPSVGSRD